MPFYRVPSQSASESVGRPSALTSRSSTFSELTEVDRDSELMRRELQLQTSGKSNGMSSSKQYEVVQQDLALQRHRELELAALRQTVYSNSNYTMNNGNSQVTNGNGCHDDEDDRDEAGLQYAHAGESRIVREFKEQRRREMELRGRWKEMGLEVPEVASINETPFTLPEPLPERRTPSKPEHTKQLVSRQDTNNEVDYQSQTSTTPKVRPFEDPDSDISSRRLSYFPADETPIEREIRLLREREDALRMARGLPPTPDMVDSHCVPVETVEVDVDFYPGRLEGNRGKDVSMKKLASTRLQMEIQKEKKREVDLKSQGSISTTSEERIDHTTKYVEIIPTSHTPDAKPYRNGSKSNVPMITSDNSVRLSSTGSCDNESSWSTPQRVEDQRRSAEVSSFPKRGSLVQGNKGRPSHAEQRIEQELREMQLREEELRIQRESGSWSSQSSECGGSER